MLTGPMIIPDTVENIVILCHGYGSNGNDMIGIAQQLTDDFRKTAFIAPNAPNNIGWGGYEWFSLNDFDLSITDKNYLARLTIRSKSAVKQLSELVNYVQMKYNVTSDKIILGGFSQGGLVAMLTALELESNPAGVIAMSAVPVYFTDKRVDSKKSFPILLTHGSADSVVPIQAMQVGLEQLTSMNFKPETCISNGLGHGVDLNCLNHIRSFLIKIIH